MSRLSLAKQKAPVIIGVVREKYPVQAKAAIRSCILHGATGIDLHVSCLEPQFQTVEAMKQIIETSCVPIMALNYNQRADRSDIGADEETRLELLYRAAEAGAAAIDMQGYSFLRDEEYRFKPEFVNAPYSFVKHSPKEVRIDEPTIAKQKAFIERIHALGCEVLMSNHPGIAMNSDEIVDYVKFVMERGVDMVKLVTVADTDEELAESFRTMLRIKREIPIPVSLHCAGKRGRISRIVNPMLGGFLTFCVDGYRPYDDLNQLDIGLASKILSELDNLR